jgi:hypothetical protein
MTSGAASWPWSLPTEKLHAKLSWPALRVLICRGRCSGYWHSHAAPLATAWGLATATADRMRRWPRRRSRRIRTLPPPQPAGATVCAAKASPAASFPSPGRCSGQRDQRQPDEENNGGEPHRDRCDLEQTACPNHTPSDDGQAEGRPSHAAHLIKAGDEVFSIPDRAQGIVTRPGRRDSPASIGCNAFRLPVPRM